MDKLSALNGTKVTTISVPEQKVFDEKVFPLALAPETSSSSLELSSVSAWVKQNVPVLQDLLTQHGAILFRDFPLKTAADFNEFAIAFGYENLPYIGGAAVRTNLVGVVFTTNEAPPHALIPFHHEMAQVVNFPHRLFFFCEERPKERGETPICLSHEVYRKLVERRPQFVENLEKKGVIYTRTIPQEDDPTSAIGRGWQSTFLTKDKEEAERRAKEQGVNVQWLENGLLRTVSNVMSAIRVEEQTKKKTFFNSIVAVFFGWRDSRNTPEKAITYGDGSPIDPEDIQGAAKIMEEISVAFKWQEGDVLLIDNHLVLHSRNTYTPPRRVLAALFK